MKPTSTIFLLGMPGCGKTHLGKSAAAKMKMAFIDLDGYIEKNEGKSIVEIFEEAGENGFRLLERKYLQRLIKMKERRIIALGGGTPCFFDNMQLIRKNGVAVYIKLPLRELIKRLTPVMHHRPLLKGKSEIQLTAYLKELLKIREPIYNQADIIANLLDDDAQALIELLKDRKEYLKG